MSPGRPVTPAEFAAILWRQAGTPEVPVQGLERFGMPAHCVGMGEDAVLLRQQAGAMAGRSGDNLAPEDGPSPQRRRWSCWKAGRRAGLPDVGQLRDDLEILPHHRPVGSQGRPMQSGI